MQIGKKYIEDNPYPKLSLAEAEQLLILPIVTRMETELLQPDNMIIEKQTAGTALYLIAKGECVVDFRHGNLHR